MKTLLFSGGLDSTVIFHQLLEAVGSKGFVATSVDYGQPHIEEVEKARRAAIANGVEWFRISATGAFSVLPTGIMQPGADLKEASAAVVKNRNAVFVSLASVFSEVVIIGCNKSDLADFPDCDPAYLKRLGDLLSVRVETPLADFTKAQVRRMANDLGVCSSDFISCYFGNSCGACAACLQGVGV